MGRAGGGRHLYGSLWTLFQGVYLIVYKIGEGGGGSGFYWPRGVKYSNDITLLDDLDEARLMCE